MGRGEHGHSHDGHNHSHSHSHGGESNRKPKSHHGHGHGHSHGHSHGKFCGCCNFPNTARLSCMVVLTFSFCVVEFVVGHLTHSISMTTDSFHMLSDVLALLIGLVSTRLSKRKPNNRFTYGWPRARTIGALVNSVFLLSLCFSIFIEAVERFFHQEELKDPKLLLLVGAIGLAINLIGLFIFGHSHGDEEPDDHSQDTTRDSSRVASDAAECSSLMELNNKMANGQSRTQPPDHHDEECEETSSKEPCCHILSHDANENMRAVFVHVMADALGSVVVIISALLNIYHEKIGLPKSIVVHIDPTLSLFLVVLIFFSIMPTIKKSALILMQTVPNSLKIADVKADLQKIISSSAGDNNNSNSTILEIHIWSLSARKAVATAHVTCESLEQFVAIESQVRAYFKAKKVDSVTIQPRFTTKQATANQRSADSIPKKSDSATTITITSETRQSLVLQVSSDDAAAGAATSSSQFLPPETC